MRLILLVCYAEWRAEELQSQLREREDCKDVRIQGVSSVYKAIEYLSRTRSEVRAVCLWAGGRGYGEPLGELRRAYGGPMLVGYTPKERGAIVGPECNLAMINFADRDIAGQSLDETVHDLLAREERVMCEMRFLDEERRWPILMGLINGLSRIEGVKGRITALEMIPNLEELMARKAA